MKELSENNLDPDPVRQFAKWFDEIKALPAIKFPEAMCLSTISADGYPDARMVLLKGFDDRGFVFYTNWKSPKGRSLATIPHAALTFYWESVRRQVRIQGDTELVTEAESDAYFRSRPRDSRIAAWSSDQSEPVADRATLEARFEEFFKKFAGSEIARPPHWLGIRVKPSRIEFWQERDNRLHDRFIYTQAAAQWKITRLYP